MKRRGEPLEKEEKNKRARDLYKKKKEDIEVNDLYLEVTTHGKKIMPSDRKKYSGSVYSRPDTKKWCSAFTGKYKHLSVYTHKTFEEAEAHLKEMNEKHNLKVKNVIYLYNDVYYCALTQKQVMKFSIHHIDLVEEHTWHALFDATSNTFYARTAARIGEGLFNFNTFHRMMFPNIKEDETVDHMNRMTLDNLPSNLRITTKSVQVINQGMKSNNTSGVKGVSYHKTANSWFAKWCENAKPVSKSFSVSKYGFEEAKNMAISVRKNIEDNYREYKEALCK